MIEGTEGSIGMTGEDFTEVTEVMVVATESSSMDVEMNMIAKDTVKTDASSTA